MRLRPLHILPLLTFVLAAVCSCRESLPKHFDDVSAVYFNFRQPNGTVVDSMAYTFVYVDDDFLDVSVPVQLLGRTSRELRPIALSLVAENCVEGVDYEIVTPASMPPDTTCLDFVLRLFRTDALKTETKLISLRLDENEEFSVPFGKTFRISFCDQFTVAPKGWMSIFVGSFSQEKFELMCDVMDLRRADLSESGLISSAKWMYIQSTMLVYVADQVRLRSEGKPYDIRAFDAEGNPLRFI